MIEPTKHLYFTAEVHLVDPDQRIIQLKIPDTEDNAGILAIFRRDAGEQVTLSIHIKL